jgi:hypothetical protein
MVTPAHDTRIGTCEPADQPGLERIINAARMAAPRTIAIPAQHPQVRDF